MPLTSEVLESWDAERNPPHLRPSLLPRSSPQVCWWVCRAHDPPYRWQSTLGSRVRRHRCKACSRRVPVPGHSDLATTHPHLAEAWDDAGCRPEEVLAGSERKVWWRCPKDGHRWQARVFCRAKGQGCPLCAGRVVVAGVNDLATTHPDLAGLWSGDNPKRPTEVSAGMALRAGWVCGGCARSYALPVYRQARRKVVLCDDCAMALAKEPPQ